MKFLYNKKIITCIKFYIPIFLLQKKYSKKNEKKEKTSLNFNF